MRGVQGADEDASEDPTVLALVLTYNSPRTLARTLEALGAQIRPPGAVLILDNASDPPAGEVVEEWDRPPDLDVRVVREPENSGPAGGWARALEEFLGSPYDLAWILDDDIAAPPDCLALLLKEYEEMGGRACVIPSVRTPTGRHHALPRMVRGPRGPRSRRIRRAAQSRLLLVGRGLRVPDVADPGRRSPDAHHTRRRRGASEGSWAVGQSAMEVLLRGQEQRLRPHVHQTRQRQVAEETHRSHRASHPSRRRHADAPTQDDRTGCGGRRRSSPRAARRPLGPNGPVDHPHVTSFVGRLPHGGLDPVPMGDPTAGIPPRTARSCPGLFGPGSSSP